MPVYLLHGFRWPRGGFTGIRVHIVIHNLDDCAAEYVQNARSQAELLKSFRTAFPEIMKELDPSTPSSPQGVGLGFGEGYKGIQFLEQYDPDDETGENAASQPYAFVADKVVTIAGGPSAANSFSNPAASAGSEPATPASAKRSSRGSVSAAIAAAAATKAQALSINVEEVVAEGPGVTATAWEAFADLRDKIAPGEKIGWWVVYNGDPERAYDSHDEDEDEGYEEGEEEEGGEEEEEEMDVDEEGAITEKTKGEQSTTPKLQQSLPGSPPVHRKRPPQPVPKPRMFEQSDPDRDTAKPSSPLSPMRSPIKESGKRQPGMKAASAFQRQQEQQQQQQGQGQGQREEGDEVMASSPPKPKVAPKSESLKKKLFGRKH